MSILYRIVSALIAIGAVWFYGEGRYARGKVEGRLGFIEEALENVKEEEV